MGEDDYTRCCERQFWMDVVVSAGLVLFAGLTSGLSLGLLSHSKVDLEVLVKAGLPKDRKNAAKILPIVKNECFLLCTLLIAKSLATEALPLFLDRILPFWGAILVSIILVVAFVEVIPQAVCTRHGLSFSAKFTVFVRFLLLILLAVSYPVSKVLDWLLGENQPLIFRRAELKTLVDLHRVKAGKGGELTDDETTIISGALGMVEKTAKDAMTPLSKAFSLDINSKLDVHTMKTIAGKGHSRIPIYSDNPANIIGLILAKNLIFYHPENETPIRKLTIRRILRVYESWSLFDVLKLFQEGHGHMAVVVKSESYAKETTASQEDANYLPSIIVESSEVGEREVVEICETPSRSLDNAMKQARASQVSYNRVHGSISNEELESLRSRFIDEEVIGIITMEDVLEELLQEQIMDETDHHVEIHDKIRVRFPSSRRSSSSVLNQLSWRTPATSFSPLHHSPAGFSSPPPSHISSPPRVQSTRSLSAVQSSLLVHQLSSVSQHISRKSTNHFDFSTDGRTS
ncbi:CBS domain protein with a domain protein [Perilla frutescens var. hirtella]|nr:CBS domain protein with a domain protein [Perilla frutescens var. hirtella]